MKFVKIGRYKINVDLVLWLDRYSEEGINVALSGAPEALVLKGNEADLLWDFLDAETPTRTTGRPPEADLVARALEEPPPAR